MSVSNLYCSISQSIVMFLPRVRHIHPCNFGHNTQEMSRIGLRALPIQELTHRIPTAIKLTPPEHPPPPRALYGPLPLRRACLGGSYVRKSAEPPYVHKNSVGIGPGLCRMLNVNFREYLLPRTPVNKGKGEGPRLLRAPAR